jgi:hypothetical protein
MPVGWLTEVARDPAAFPNFAAGFTTLVRLGGIVLGIDF